MSHSSHDPFGYFPRQLHRRRPPPEGSQAGSPNRTIGARSCRAARRGFTSIPKQRAPLEEDPSRAVRLHPRCTRDNQAQDESRDFRDQLPCRRYLVRCHPSFLRGPTREPRKPHLESAPTAPAVDGPSSCAGRMTHTHLYLSQKPRNTLRSSRIPANLGCDQAGWLVRRLGRTGNFVSDVEATVRRATGSGCFDH
jgi:hypothetical protein